MFNQQVSWEISRRDTLFEEFSLESFSLLSTQEVNQPLSSLLQKEERKDENFLSKSLQDSSLISCSCWTHSCTFRVFLCLQVFSFLANRKKIKARKYESDISCQTLWFPFSILVSLLKFPWTLYFVRDTITPLFAHSIFEKRNLKKFLKRLHWRKTRKRRQTMMMSNEVKQGLFQRKKVCLLSVLGLCVHALTSCIVWTRILADLISPLCYEESSHTRNLFTPGWLSKRFSLPEKHSNSSVSSAASSSAYR